MSFPYFLALFIPVMLCNVVSNILNAPKNIIPLCLIPVGYPAEEKNIKDKWKPENIHYDGWN